MLIIKTDLYLNSCFGISSDFLVDLSCMCVCASMQSVGGGGRVKAQLMCGKELLLLGGKQLSSVICTCHCYSGRRHGEGAERWLQPGRSGEKMGGERFLGRRWVRRDGSFLCATHNTTHSPPLAITQSLSNADFEISKSWVNKF